MNILIIILGFTLLFLLTITIFYSKKKIEKTEKNKIFKFMIVFTFISVISELLGNIIFINNDYYVLSSVIAKIFMISVLTNLYLYTCYNFLTTKNMNSFKENKKLFITRRVYFFIYLISLFLIIATESLFSSNTIVNYSYGISSDILFLSIIFYFITWLVSLFFNYDKIENENSLLYIYLLVGLYSLVIRIFFPQIVFISLIEVYLITYIYLKEYNVSKEINNNDDFVKDLSYKMRVPLNAIVGFSEYITKAKTLEEAKESASDVIDTSNYLLNTVNNYLDMVESNDKLELHETDYNAYIMFESIIDYAKDRVGNDNVKLKTHVSDDIPEMLYGDYVNIKKIVNSLINNSVKLTNKGYIDLSIKCIKQHGLCRLIISIKDTGMGIKKEELDNLFNSDLALMNSKKLVDMMGGKIIIESELGKGTKYSFAVDQKTSNKVIEKDSVEIVETLNLKGKDILVVDDNKLILKMIKRMLENFNANVITVTSGMECIKAVEKEKYDLILIDENMPRMNGSDTIVKLRQLEDFNTPTIILIANKDNAKKHLDEGFNDYLLKPINHNNLHDILSKYIRITVEPELVVDDEDIINIDNNPNKNNIDFLIDNGIDANKGIELLGDIVMYNDMLAEFNEEIDARIEKLNEYKDTDLKSYTIEVHSLKSDSQYLGFNKLAEFALKHELEAKKDNQEFINENFDELMNLLNDVLKIIREYL